MKLLVKFIQRIGLLHGWRLAGHCGVLILLIWIPMQLIDQLGEVLFSRKSDVSLLKDIKGVIVVVLLAPLFETLGMRFVFWGIRRYWHTTFALYFGSAIFWAAMHYTSASWGLHAAWGFFVFGAIYLALEPISKDRALLFTALIHALCNGLTYVVYVLTR